MKNLSSKYLTQANRLAKAVDIANKILNGTNLIPEEVKEFQVKLGVIIKEKALNPDPPFRKIASLKYLQADFLKYWLEEDNEMVDNFWTQLRENGIGFERGILKAILKRNTIKDTAEYDFITDNIVVAEQQGKITKSQAIQLSRLLSEFEETHGK